MTSYLILAQSQRTAAALNSWLKFLLTPASLAGDISTLVCGFEVIGREQRASLTYDNLVHRIEMAIRAEHLPLNRIFIIVDSVRPSSLDPIAEGLDWNSLVAMLILTFPEVKWLFGAFVGNAPEFLQNHHSLSTLLVHSRREPLLDPTGLREWVRNRANASLRDLGDDMVLPKRNLVCAAIDEETQYAYLHAYTGYRFGLRSDLVTSWALMHERFGIGLGPHGYWLLLEDMSLNFPDREGSYRLLQLADRARILPFLDSSNPSLENSQHRVLITSGQARPNDRTLVDNEQYLRSKAVGKGKRIFKPAAGIFDLWKKADLLKNSSKSGRAGNVDGFCWPPEKPGSVEGSRGHGAPGKLMQVGRHLVRRAAALDEATDDISIAIQGAVLCTEALELLSGRTPTVALEALTLKHRFEVLAECQFSGVEHHAETRARLNEIAVEARALSIWFNVRQRNRAAMNAEMRVVNELVKVFREQNLFDEEQSFLIRARKLHHSLWMGVSVWRRLMWPIFRYLEILLSSFATFIGIVCCWIVVLSILFWQTGSHHSLAYGVADAISSFFAVGSPIHPSLVTADTMSVPYVIVICVAILSGALHLGVLISYLYSLATRR